MVSFTLPICESTNSWYNCLCTERLCSPLTPNTTNARPTIAPPPSPPNSGLSSGVKAGIAVAVSVIVFACLVCFAFLMRAREQSRLQRRRRQQQQQPQPQPQYNHPHTPPPIHEKEAEHYYASELECRQRPELIGSVLSSPADSMRDLRPFYKRVSIYR